MKLSGTLHSSPLGASQLPVDSDWIVTVSASWLVWARNGWMKVWFRSGALSSPATDQTWLNSAPYVHGPACRRATAVGPKPHFSPVRGSCRTGPTPQVQRGERAGEK